MVANLVRLIENITSDLEIEVEVADGVESPLFLQEKPYRPINDEIDAQITVKTRTMKDITSAIKMYCYILKLKESGNRTSKDVTKI